MTNSQQTTLVLGGTGRTGSRVAKNLIERGLSARTAARGDADVRFDWDDRTTHGPALSGVDSVYLVTPVMRVDFAPQVSDFLDLAQAAGVRHVTYLSAYGVDQLPPDWAIRSVELDLLSRTGLTHSILRPAWVMQNFTDDHLPLVEGLITVPTGDGTEAFVDAEDIATVAAETLANPGAHAGAQYAPTGPEALTVADVAKVIGDVLGRPVKHNDMDREAWISGAVASGFVPAEYGEMLRWLTGTIASGNGSRPTEDVRKVTGAPPTSVADFAKRNAQAWTADAAR
jgi:uncharacterized protein YbjT (DUF2867 family)